MNLAWTAAIYAEIKKPILVCDIVQYGMNSFGTAPQTWRVTHHKRRVEDTIDEKLAKATDIGEQITLEVCREAREKERARRIKQGLPATRRYCLMFCKPEEATHVSLTGICGNTAPISECIRRGTVSWTPEHIAENRKSAAGNFWLSNNFSRDWYWE